MPITTAVGVTSANASVMQKNAEGDDPLRVSAVARANVSMPLCAIIATKVAQMSSSTPSARPASSECADSATKSTADAANPLLLLLPAPASAAFEAAAVVVDVMVEAVLS